MNASQQLPSQARDESDDRRHHGLATAAIPAVTSPTATVRARDSKECQDMNDSNVLTVHQASYIHYVAIS